MEQQGAIYRAFVWMFGANWKTSLSGVITVICYYIHSHPEWIQWIPEPGRGIIWSGSEYVFMGAFGALAWRAKDKAVTGGSKQQTYSGATADEGSQTLVDQTVQASIKSGEKVPAEVENAAKS